MKLVSSDQKIRTSGEKLYEKSVLKHLDVEPLTHRLREKTTLRNIISNVEAGDATKAKTEVIIHINQKDMIKTAKDSDGNDFDYENHSDYDFIYNSIKKRLHSEVEKVFKIKKSMKIQSVVDFIIKRHLTKEDGHDPKPKFPDSYIKKIDGGFWEFTPMISSTKAQEMVSSNFTQTLNTQQDRLKNLFIQDSNNLGSEWRLDRFKRFIVACYTIRPPRASSYIPTPEPYNSSRCGLINIQNNDNKCFQWCLKYHQSDKSKHCDRIAILSKMDDKYNYDNVSYPASIDDIKTLKMIMEIV